MIDENKIVWHRRRFDAETQEGLGVEYDHSGKTYRRAVVLPLDASAGELENARHGLKRWLRNIVQRSESDAKHGADTVQAQHECLINNQIFSDA